MCTQLFSPKVDYVFKNIFGSEKHPRILISFLNACLKQDKKITKVQIKNTELTKEYIEESFSRLDVLATTEDNEVINIKMQRIDEKNMIKRSLYYWSKVYTSEYKGKGRYSNLPRTICINILDFELLDEEGFHNIYNLKNRHNNNLLTDTIELHFVEIPKMKELDQSDMLSLWTAFINDPNNEKLVELETKYKELHEAKIELARISRDPKEAEKYRMRENAMNERQNALLEAMDKGIKQGRDERSLEVAKNLLDILDNETIAIKTDLPIDIIKNLRN